MIEEFKKFAIKGNVIDLAVGVIIGGAFGKIVTSLVQDMMIPILGILLGGVKFSNLSISFGEEKIMYGSFIQSIVDFLIISISIFIFIKLLSPLMKKKEEKEKATTAPSKEEQLLAEIRDLLKQKVEF